MIKCSKCSSDNPRENSYCARCGTRLRTFFEKWHWLFLAIWVFGVGSFLFMLPDSETQLTTAEVNPKTVSFPQEKKLPPEVDPKGVYHSEITMPDGSTGIFDIYLLDKKYVWKTGSETVIDGLGDFSVKDHWQTAFTKPLQELIKNAREIIVVGTADIRNEKERENARAGNRSRTLLNVVTEMRGNGQSAFNWNLGQWKGSTNVPFEDQRRVIFIEIVSRSKGLDLKEGVRLALEMNQAEQPIFKDLLDSYSKSEDFEIR